MDPDELVLVLRAAGDVVCVAQIVAAVYDASFSMQEPFLCIGFFETLAQLPTETLSAVLETLLVNSETREVGVGLIVEAPIFLKAQTGICFGACYEQISKNHRDWYQTTFELVRRYGVMPEDQPFTITGDTASARDRYLIGMGKLAQEETKESGIKDLVSLTNRKESSLELLEQVALVLLQESETNAGRPELRALCQKGLRNLDERGLDPEIAEMIKMPEGAGWLKRARFSWQAHSPLQDSDAVDPLKQAIAAGGLDALDALMAYSNKGIESRCWWDCLKVDSIEDWRGFRVERLPQKGQPIRINSEQINQIPTWVLIAIAANQGLMIKPRFNDEENLFRALADLPRLTQNPGSKITISCDFIDPDWFETTPLNQLSQIKFQLSSPDFILRAVHIERGVDYQNIKNSFLQKILKFGQSAGNSQLGPHRKMVMDWLAGFVTYANKEYERDSSPNFSSTTGQELGQAAAMALCEFGEDARDFFLAMPCSKQGRLPHSPVVTVAAITCFGRVAQAKMLGDKKADVLAYLQRVAALYYDTFLTDPAEPQNRINVAAQAAQALSASFFL